MTWSMANVQWNGTMGSEHKSCIWLGQWPMSMAWRSEHKSRTWLGPWPSLNGMEHGALNTSAVHGNGQCSMAWNLGFRTQELYMAWSMAKFQWHGAWSSEDKSLTWLGQWPMSMAWSMAL